MRSSRVVQAAVGRSLSEAQHALLARVHGPADFPGSCHLLLPSQRRQGCTSPDGHRIPRGETCKVRASMFARGPLGGQHGSELRRRGSGPVTAAMQAGPLARAVGLQEGGWRDVRFGLLEDCCFGHRSVSGRSDDLMLPSDGGRECFVVPRDWRGPSLGRHRSRQAAECRPSARAPVQHRVDPDTETEPGMPATAQETRPGSRVDDFLRLLSGLQLQLATTGMNGRAGFELTETGGTAGGPGARRSPEPKSRMTRSCLSSVTA